MIDKIYSRRRIRIKLRNRYKDKNSNQLNNNLNNKKNKKSKMKKVLGIICIFIFAFFLFVIEIIIPVFKSNCLSKANSLGIKVVNDEVKKVMKEYSYDDLIITHKDLDGRVNFLESNIIAINEIISKITINIQEKIDENESSRVYINMGTISGISTLKNVGPSVGILLETGGNVKAKIKTEFTESGINQTLHRVYVDINTIVKIVTPVAVYSKEIESKILIAEAIIVGDIPETYYNLEGMDSGDVMEVME